jgi:hypothetical protein
MWKYFKIPIVIVIMEQTFQSARQLIFGDVLGLNLGPEISYQTKAEACEIFLQNLL